MNNTHCFFGEIGTGKSFLAKKFALNHNLPFYEGDDFLPAQLRKKIAQGCPLSKKEVNHFFYSALMPGLISIRQKNFVFAQTLYQNQHRLELHDAFNGQITFHLVHTNITNQIKFLAERKYPIRWISAMLIAKPFFQYPSHIHLDHINIPL